MSITESWKTWPNMTSIALSSYGGCGTTYLTSQLQRKQLITGFKHIRRPPANPDNNAVAYLYGNPMDVIICHFARQETRPQWNNAHARNIESKSAWTAEGIKFLGGNLERFIDNGVDYFELEDHFDSWINFQGYPILYIKYETMFKHVEEIAHYFKISGLELVEQKRSSDWTNHSLRDKLLKMYEPLWNKIQEQPEIRVS